MGYSLWGRTELFTTERLTLSKHIEQLQLIKKPVSINKRTSAACPLGWVGSQTRLLHIRVWGPGLPAGPALASCPIILRGSGGPHTSDHHPGSQGQAESCGAAAQTLRELCMLWPQQGNI